MRYQNFKYGKNAVLYGDYVRHINHHYLVIFIRIFPMQNPFKHAIFPQQRLINLNDMVRTNPKLISEIFQMCFKQHNLFIKPRV